jgi:hypothetical protein
MIQPKPANEITAANACGPRQVAIRTPWAARIAEFHRWAIQSGIAMKNAATKARSIALLVSALFWLQPVHAQYVEVSATIEGTSWPFSSSGQRAEHRRTYTTRCIFGTDLWFIEDDGPLNAKETWWCTGTNIIQRTVITMESPEHAGAPFLPGPRGPPLHIGDTFVTVHRASEAKPLTGIPNLTWLAFCSGSFLKAENRRLLPPFSAQGISGTTSDKTETFRDALGLPNRVEIYSPNDELICVYEVRQSTNFSGWNVPLQFEFTQFEARGSKAPERYYHALGTVRSVRYGTEPRIPSDLREKVREQK